MKRYFIIGCILTMVCDNPGCMDSFAMNFDLYTVSWDAGVPESDSVFVSNYGYLYSADAGHCPEGWHVPEIEEAGGGGIGGGYVTIGGLHNAYYEQSRWWSSTPVNMENWPYTIGLPPPYYYYGDGSGDLHYPAVPEYYYHKTCVKNVE